MRSLVTGAAGFIGAHVVKALLKEGHEVRALYLPDDDLRNLQSLPIERVLGDVTKPDQIKQAVKGCDYVFHLAAIYEIASRDPQKMYEVNVEGTRIVLQASKEVGVRRVVYTSSIACFGGQGLGKQATEESLFQLGKTGDPYSLSKHKAHQIVIEAANAGQDIVIVAPTGPIGPGDVRPTPTGRLLLACLSFPVIFVLPTMVNFADVRDIAKGHILAAYQGISGECYLLGNQDFWLKDLAKKAQFVLGVKKPIVEVPFFLAELGGHLALLASRLKIISPLFSPAAVSIARLGLSANCSKAISTLGLPQSSIEDALQDAFSWFSSEGYFTA